MVYDKTWTGDMPAAEEKEKDLCAFAADAVTWGVRRPCGLVHFQMMQLLLRLLKQFGNHIKWVHNMQDLTSMTGQKYACEGAEHNALAFTRTAHQIVGVKQCKFRRMGEEDSRGAILEATSHHNREKQHHPALPNHLH